MQPQDVTAAPPPPPPPIPRAGEAVTVTTTQVGSPRAAYVALREKREVIGDQMSRVLNRRDRVNQQIANAEPGSAARLALEEHLQGLNARIIDLEKQLHAADIEVAAAAGVPGATVPEARPSGRGPDDDAWSAAVVIIAVAVAIFFLAWARRMWRGAGKVVAQIPAALEARFTRFEQSIDAMAIEIERVSEGQRFLTRVLSDDGARALGVGPAQPVESRDKVPEAVRGG